MSESENNAGNGAAEAAPKANEADGAEKPATSEQPPPQSSPPDPPADPLASAQADVARLRDQLLRTAADFDNYRKRTRRDIEDAQKKGTEELLRNLLPVFDNLERAVTHAEQAADSKAIADGVKMVLKQFVDTLARSGIKRVAGVGTSFDPLVHEAIQQVESSDTTPGTIVAEIAPGYQLGDRLIRAAMVVVAKAPAS